MNATATNAKPVTILQAINSALADAMAEDETVLVLGEDVADPEEGGVVGVTKGLSTRFGDHRVRSTPISEQAIIGAAIGASLVGFKPVAEIMLMNFTTVAMDKPGNTGLVSLSSDGHVQLEIAPGSIDRAERCLLQIVAAAKAQGFELSAKASKAAFTNGSVAIPFAIKEGYKRIKHVLTAEEIAEDERRQRRRSRDWSRSDWTPHSFSFGRPEWDYVPTGQLAFEFDIYLRYASQVRRAFKDAKLQRLENLAPDIAVGFAVLAAAKAEDDQKAEEARQREEEAKRRRIEAQRLAYIAERRDKVLEDVLARLERRDRLAAFVTRLEEELAGEQATRVAVFLTWARTKLAAADQRLSATGLNELFQEHHIFGADDDRGFYPESYW